MPTASLIPTYYRVTWTGNSPTDYNALTGNQAGGIDNTHPERYNRMIRITGTDSSVSVTNGHSFKINQVTVTFTTAGGLNLAGVISTINLLTTEHHVYAVELPSNYVTLINASGWEGNSIELGAGSTGTALADCGLTAGVYNAWPFVASSAMNLPLTNLDNIKINGVTVTFVTGALDLTGVVNTINAASTLTNVVAYKAGAGMALASLVGQPFTLAAGTTVGTLGALGLTAGNQGGSPSTLAQSLNKERATMRWDNVVIELGQLISPVFLGEIVKTGNYDGTAAVTTLTFTVGYDRANYLVTENELSAGNYLYGADCVKRLIARALVQTTVGNQEIFDPTITTFGTECARVNPTQIMEITQEAIDAVADIVTVENNISVVQVANV